MGWAEHLIGAEFPTKWPGRALVERAFCCPIETLRKNPEHSLWGGRAMVLRHGDPWVIGSVITSGAPNERAELSIGYGVETASQGQGYATEAVERVVRWALEDANVDAVTANTFPWNRASIRVLEKAGMELVATDDHDMLGEMLCYERRRTRASATFGAGASVP